MKNVNVTLGFRSSTTTLTKTKDCMTDFEPEHFSQIFIKISATLRLNSRKYKRNVAFTEEQNLNNRRGKEMHETSLDI